MQTFTELAVRSLPEGTYFEKVTPAFGLRVGKRRRTWFVVRRGHRTTVGVFPIMSVQEARRRARTLLNGHLAPSLTPLFIDARTMFLNKHGATLRPRSLYQIKRTLNRHFHWTKTLDTITSSDIAEAVQSIAAPSEAAHAFKDIRTFFNWCVPQYIPHSPCTGLKSPSKYVPRDKLLTDDEIVRIWRAAEGDYGLAVRRLIATGQRANQIFSLVPEWVRGDLIVFPASVMKGNVEHTIPFGKLTATLVREFPLRTNQSKGKVELDKRSGVTGWVIHDLRRYFSSTHAKLRTPIDITEALLSHVSGSRSQIQRIYDLHDRLDAKRKAVENYEKYLRSHLR